ncbi:hypothetical protein M407DRAFT_243222 [Tulasnella calospora MUT 4182]|uniref:Uncharacterized protein n=1 Tax=Tulasnella calospora MUT 4182 TaxID=1051891 RepID=A0A0C3L278_9AGAM|nr:hypothetical protein M407DRAFT_243222 [Tulasnella calospora MUT 4182]
MSPRQRNIKRIRFSNTRGNYEMRKDTAIRHVNLMLLPLTPDNNDSQCWQSAFASPSPQCLERMMMTDLLANGHPHEILVARG